MTARGWSVMRSALFLMMLSLGTLACGENDSEGGSAAQGVCAREPMLIQSLDDGPMSTACLGDVVMLGLRADGAGNGEMDVPFYVAEAQHVSFCVDTVQSLVRSVALHDRHGQRRLAAEHGACAGADIEPGDHYLRITHTFAGQADAPAAMLFIRTPPQEEAGLGSASGQLLSTSVVISDSCPFCDLTNVNLQGVWFYCTDPNISSSLNTGYPESIGAGTCTYYYGNGSSYHGGNNFSGAFFGGANLSGATFLYVYFRNTQFYDEDDGPAVFGVADDVFGDPKQATQFDYCDLRGASFQHANLSNVVPVGNNSLRSPFFNIANLQGADLRYANLNGNDFSSFKYSNGQPPNEGSSKLAGVKMNSSTDIRGANFSFADASGLDWHVTDWSQTRMQHTNLSNGNMSGFNLTAAPYAGKFFISDKNTDYFAGANMTGVNFSGANLAGLDLTNAQLTTSNFASANLYGAHLSGANFTKANFSSADLGSATAAENNPVVFNGATMTHVFMKSASMPGSFFRGVSMAPANLGGAVLSGAWFEVDPLCFDSSNNCLVNNLSCVCQPATLSRSYMLNTDLSGAHMTDVVLDYVSWYNVSSSSPIATGADAFLTGASFNLADLPGLDLTGARLEGAVLTNTQLIGANLTGAQLQRDGSTRTNLSTANLRGANLTGANLDYANLQNAGASAVAESEVYIEVLADPDHYQAAESYQYFAVNRPPTILGASDTVTDFATCPSGVTGPCGPITSPNWVAPNPPQEPDCTTTTDSQGNVISVTCSSSRHPAN